MISFLQAENISKNYGEKILFDDINIYISEGDHIAVVAKNGTGKSTLLNIIAGKDPCDSGKISYKNDLKIAYLLQDINLDPNKNVIDAVFSQQNEISEILKKYNEIIFQETENSDLQSLLDKIEALNLWDFEAKIKQILGILKITDFDKKISELSGGQQKRVALASVLITEPDLFILDEPTNHLDLAMIEWLEDYLQKSKSAIFMVTHDRYFLDRICNNILELENGKIYSYSGNYSYYIEKRAERLENINANLERSQNLLRKEQEWIKRMPKARTHKSKARIEDFDKIKEKATQFVNNKVLQIGIETSHLGNKVINIFNINKSYGDECLIKDFSYKIAKYEKIGIVGNNGSGKTTFLNILTGTIKQDTGRIEIGSTVKIAYYKQTGIHFHEDDKPIDIIKRVAETIKLKNGKTFNASGFLNYFLFSPLMQTTFVRKLSGGEKRRLYLCSILMQQPNVLILDEPTNDLDIVTLQVLEEFLMEIDASIIIVSHDRFFMDKIVEHIFIFNGKGEIKDFPGNYSQYRNSDFFIEQQNIDNQKETKIKKEKPKAEIQNSKQRKLSFNEQFELKNIECEIVELEERKALLEIEINSGNLPNNELIDKSQEFSEILKLLQNKEFRWIELSEE
ncbi:MAG: ABC-F family ATP-binding cassette domain-containing protein [Bacteroidales bacterium]|jgi:ATP-binding cassette subfamily F protein uup|nr:ABC-F family ATP-binding cassette domain-containing protein [Bacteroidales bacterium]